MRIFSLSLILLASSSILLGNTVSYAEDMTIIPEPNKTSTEISDDVQDVWWQGADKQWTVRDRYNQKANGYKDDLGSQFATGIFSRDGVLQFIVKIIQFISQWWLLVGAGFIIYTWYQYAYAVFQGKEPGTGAIKDAVIGILIIIFSYAIIKVLNAAFL